MGSFVNDLNLIYSGGSGGFLLLHILFLSGKYTAELRGNVSIENALKQQWEITDLHKWKLSEVWPDNKKTHELATDLKKIYFHCNPTVESLNKNIKTITIYTDIQSQKLLAFSKRAHWYFNKNKLPSDLKFADYMQLLRQWKQHYNNVKDSSWPKCISFRHINRLPANVQQELINDPYTERFLKYHYNETDTAMFNGIRVHSDAYDYISCSDAAFLLQDIVNTRGQVLVDVLGIPPINCKQIELIKHWCSLHPVDLLERIGIQS